MVGFQILIYGIFESASDAVQLSITFLGTICLWNGVINIAYKTSIIKKLGKIFMPFMKILFPKLDENGEAYKNISMNLIANFLGLGNAATPLGLKAMKELQKQNRNKEILSNYMVMFIVINTASLQIIPTTVIAIRTSLGSKNPTEVVFPIWIVTLCSAIVAIIVTKILIKKSGIKDENN